MSSLCLRMSMHLVLETQKKKKFADKRTKNDGFRMNSHTIQLMNEIIWVFGIWWIKNLWESNNLIGNITTNLFFFFISHFQKFSRASHGFATSHIIFLKYINVLSLFSHEWWVLLIKFMIGTIHMRGRIMTLMYSRSIL